MAEDTYIQTLEKVSVTIDGETLDIVAASYRGVPFFVESYQQGGLGRTVATKKIPFSKDYVNEDVGANVPTNTMSIFLVGDDCDIQKQSLIAACGREGAAELVHPWLGRLQARVSQLSFSATRSELGYIKGSVTFVLEEDVPNRSVAPSNRLKAKTDAASFRASQKKSFVDRFNALKKAKGKLDEAVSASETALDNISEARKTLNEVNEFVNEIGKLKANIGVALDSPADFAARIENLLTTTADIFGYDADRNSECDEFISLMASGASGIVGDLLRNMAASCLASSLVDADFASVDEAAEFQDRVTAAFGAMLNDTDDIDAYMGLSGLEASALSYLRDVMADMAVVIDKPVKSTTNILTLAYDTYNDVDRIGEIMLRNGFPQGLFVTPGNVKVLSK